MNLTSLQWHIMDATADDWESIVQIQSHVSEYCGHHADSTIFDVLQDLNRRGLIRLMDGEGHATDIFPEDPTGFWFSMTEAGTRLWDSEGYKYRGEDEET